MSASVKPSSQQIGAIGTKAGAVGQTPYGQQYMGMYAAPPQQPPPPQNLGKTERLFVLGNFKKIFYKYINYFIIFLEYSGSSSYYSNSAGGQGTFCIIQN